MQLEAIEQKVRSLSPFVKEIKIRPISGALFASVIPDLTALKEAKIVNIEEEIRWYAIELYNLLAKEDEKIQGYEIISPQSSFHKEPADPFYETLKRFLAIKSSKEISFTSHIELDLGLDSLDYVELFLFVERSFGIEMNEALFSGMMRVNELYSHIKQNARSHSYSPSSWQEFLTQKSQRQLIASPFCMLLYKTLLYPLFQLYFRLEAKGIKNIPKSACIIAPSHQSMLDGFLVEALLPAQILKKSYFLSYKQVFGKNILKHLAQHGQNILIDANENLKESLLAATLPLREGDNIVIFPEGARSRDGKLLEFRPFFALLAKVYGVPVVPVAIDGSFEALRAGMFFPRPKKIKVTFLQPIVPQDLSYEEIVQRTKSAIEHELKSSS